MKGTWWVRPEQLDDAQRKVIALPPDGNYLVTGPPGSGKTNLLVLRADYLHRSGRPNLIVLVFNRTLEEFIAHCPGPYGVPREKLSTLQRWQMQLINQLGGVPSAASKFVQARQENCEILHGLVAAERLRGIYDVILLDEAQDYWAEELDLIFSLGVNVFAVADSRQRIYDHSDSIPSLLSRCDTTELQFHYRNGHQICRVADGVGSNWADYVQMLPASQYNERAVPSRAELVECVDVSDQLRRVLSALGLQIKAYPDEMIGILCARRNELALARDALRSSDYAPVTVYQASDEGYLPFGSDTRVCVCSVHGAKGLEFRAVHLVGAEYLRNFRRLQRRMAYTGITRAKSALDVYYSATIPHYLEGAFAAIAPPATAPRIEDLFER